MNEVEVGFKISNSLEESKQILKENGFEHFYSAQVDDTYFSNLKLNEKMSEQQLKFSCVRLRTSKNKCSFHNFKLFDKNQSDCFDCSSAEANRIILNLLQNNFKQVFNTSKTDDVYKKENMYCQLQNIKDIGLINYVYDEDIFCKDKETQFNYLKEKLINMGFKLEYEEGVDKLRTLLAHKLKFSKNQNGDYKFKN